MKNFYENSPYKEQLETLIDKIFKNTKYPEVKFQNRYIVESIAKKYVYLSLKMSENGLTYYSGMTVADEAKFRLNNVFIKALYMDFKGVKTDAELEKTFSNFDWLLRDQIWIVCSLIMQYAQTDNQYMKFWKPATFTEMKTPVYTEDKKSFTLPIIAGIAVIGGLFAFKKRGN